MGTTVNHPFWSVDRNDFVRADSLAVGEQLQSLNGIVRVTGLSPRGPPEPVFNLEVQVKHTYHVADSGVLVHNGQPCIDEVVTLYHGTDFNSALKFLNGAQLDSKIAAAKKIDGAPGFYLADQFDDAYYFGSRHGNKFTVLKYELSAKAVRSLENAGSVFRPIPVGDSFVKGNELFISNDIFDLFNKLVKSGDIKITPGL
ncbi:MAG: polymorphic toxin-type HINT domain-containing protein [Pseudomonadales bacterium]